MTAEIPHDAGFGDLVPVGCLDLDYDEHLLAAVHLHREVNSPPVAADLPPPAFPEPGSARQAIKECRLNGPVERLARGEPLDRHESSRPCLPW
jgi:hypothetical protein